MTRFFRLMTLFPFAFFIVLLVGVGVFAGLYVSTSNALFLYFLIGYAVAMLIIYLAIVFSLSRRFNMIFVRGLYSITLYNLRNITDNENALIDYPNNTYDEFVSLNEQVNSLKTELDTSTLIAGNSDFSRINLDYIDVDRNVITLRSFRANLESVIFASQNYRNA